jgi:hypothetical protein
MHTSTVTIDGSSQLNFRTVVGSSKETLGDICFSLYLEGSYLTLYFTKAKALELMKKLTLELDK